MVNHPNRSKTPTHTTISRGWGVGHDKTMLVNVRLVRARWVSSEGYKFRANDGVWDGDRWGRVRLDLTTLAPITKPTL